MRSPRLKSWLRRWWYVLALLIGLVLLAVATFHIVYLHPRRILNRAAMEGKDLGPERTRMLCHQVLRFPGSEHDVFIYLINVGDETSVTHLLRGFRRGPRGSGQIACTWSHGLEALRAVTNNDPGTSYEAWREWYSANRHKSRLEWIADGFSVEGHAVSVTGGEETIRTLLSILGEPLWGESPTPYWRYRNARLLLESYSKDETRPLLKRVIRSGSAQEKRGAAFYWLLSKDRGAEPLLRELLRDGARSVRLRASSVLVQFDLERLKNPPGYLLKRLYLRHEPRGRGAVSAQGIIYFPALETLVAYDPEQGGAIWRLRTTTRSLHGSISPLMLDGERLFFVSEEGALFCVRASDGTVLWERKQPQMQAYKAPASCGEYLVVEADVGDGPGKIALRTKEDGQVVARAKGELLSVHGSTVFVSDGGCVRALSPPHLAVKAEFAVKHRPLGVGVQGDTAAIVLTDYDGNSSSERAKVWVEGWSLATGKRTYSREIFDGEVEWESRALPSGQGVLYVCLQNLTCAINVTDGSIRWETALGGDLILLEDALVVAQYGELRILDAATGEVLAHYEPEGASSFFDHTYLIGGRLHAISKKTMYIFPVPKHPAME